VTNPERTFAGLTLAITLLLALPRPGLAQRRSDSITPAEHGQQYSRLLIRNVHVIDGNGTPTRGPMNVIVENDLITAVGARAGGEFEAVIDGRGRYLLPGLINLHAHLQDNRGGIDMPFAYQFNLWLACGITTVRDVGSDLGKALSLRQSSERGRIAAPRIFIYARAGGATPEEARASVRRVHESGADGVKIFGLDAEPMAALLDEAHKLGLRVAHHVGVEETDAWDDIAGGTTTIEHWYGIPDAAIPYGSQGFPPGYNYSNELDRFRWAGRLWKDADPEKLSLVLQGMVEAGVAWCPTLTIYEASRDVQRARTQPWFADYLHPALEAYFRPDLQSHGSYFLGWTTEDEIEWKHNYELWFAALREYAERGGLVCVGEDAGFIYRLYGFALIRELELQQEAGFHPLDVIRHATGNNALALGREHELGRVRAGFKADLILVNGNPQENFKLLYPTGTDVYADGEYVHGGTVAWTIKDGYCYRGSLLMEEVREMVTQARAEGRER